MTDDRLREAERVYRETGDVSAETRLLAERVRAGTLDRERLELAAELRYEPAVLAVGGAARPTTHSPGPVLEALERFGRPVVARAALVLARAALRRREYFGYDTSCAKAIERWVECPCAKCATSLEHLLDEAERDEEGGIQEPLLDVAREVLGHARYAKEAYSVREGPGPQAAHVAALRRELVRWALAPHEPVARRGSERGSLLELVIGGTPSSWSTKLLVAPEKILVGGSGLSKLLLPAPVETVEIRRTETGFEVEPFEGCSGVHLGEAPLEGKRPLATGDVISLRHSWVEVRVLDAPFDAAVESALREAERIRPLLGDQTGRGRIRAAAAAGHAGATLVASGAGIPLGPRPEPLAWVESIGYAPRGAVWRGALFVAREADAVWRRAHPRERAPARALGALEVCLRSPTAENASDVRRLAKEARLAVERASKGRKESERVLAAGRAVLAAPATLDDDTAAASVARHAVAAGLREERVRELMAEGILRWDLG